jgi:hypothetical protein
MRLPQLSPAIDRSSSPPNGSVRGEVQPQNGCQLILCTSNANCPPLCPYCVSGLCRPLPP